MKATGVLIGMVLATSAAAQPLDFVVDPMQSSIDLTIEIDLGTLGGDTDSDSSSVSGMVTASFDDPAAASESSLYDFFGAIDNDLQFDWVPAFLSTASATLTGGSVEYAEPGTILGPVPVMSGDVTFPMVPTIVSGVLTVNYNIFLFGSGSEIINLADLGPTADDISGMIVVGMDDITLTNTIAIETSQPLIVEGSEIGTVIVTGSATLVATAELPSCVPDFTDDGQLNFLDVSAFLGLFAAQDPAADINVDGQYNFLDVSLFLSLFGAGCP